MYIVHMKITKAKIKSFIKNKLATDQDWALRALVRIWEKQTAAEQASEVTIENNSVGFSGVDGNFFSSLATQYQRRGSLSPKQMSFVFKRMPKYWSQIETLLPKEKWVELVTKG